MKVGAHTLSGAVIDPIGLDMFLQVESLDPPAMSEVIDDEFYILGPAGSLRIPNFSQG